MIKITNIITGRAVQAREGEEPPKVTGFGGWEEVARPKREALSDWTGAPAVRLTLDLIFDGWRERESVQEDVNDLQEWAWPSHGKRPPHLKVRGPNMPLGEGRQWVIEDLDFGERLIGFLAGSDVSVLMRQQVTVTLMEFNPPDVLGDRKRGSGASKKGRYKTVKGDTLKAIAAKRLGAGKHWRKLLSANPKLRVRDPNKKLSVGLVLKLPHD